MPSEEGSRVLGLRSLGSIQWLLCSPFHLRKCPEFLNQVPETSITSFGTEMEWGEVLRKTNGEQVMLDVTR